MSDDSRPVVPPVVLASTFAFADTAGEARAAAERTPHLYSRWSNPTVEAVEAQIAALEGGERALLTASGMAAVSLALLDAARRGPILAQTPVYGGTHELCRWLGGFDVEVRRATPEEMPTAAAALGPEATVYLEIPANPTNRVVDLPAVRAATSARIVVDATFATPVLFRPLAHGADLVLHSATKYLSGHHDVIAGALCGSTAHIEPLWTLRKLLGPTLDPAAAYRLHRGLETLRLRVERQSATAIELAARLDAHPGVRAVHHPSLPSHPDHAVAARLLPDGAGGVLSFEVADARAVGDRLRVFTHAPSLGGTRSLVSWPAGVSHVHLDAAARAAAGVPDGLLRLAIGLEEADALWADLEAALNDPAALD